MDTPSSDFEELLALFNSNGVRCVVVGGHALAFHGRPRYTKDLDIFVEASAENAARILKSLEAFGFGDVGLADADFAKPGQIVQLGFPPNRIDILTLIEGVTFDQAWAGRVSGAFGHQSVSFIGKDEFIRNKRAVGRLQDLADIEALGG